MSDAVAIAIAKAVVTELNGHSFSSEFTAARYYLPVFPLEEMSTLHVSVVPKAVTDEMSSRSTTVGEYSVDIAVEQQVEPETLAPIDALMLLVEEIVDFFRLRPLTEYPTAVWVKTEYAPIFSPKRLEEHRLFTSVITLTFTVAR